jgi:hypothetical protein
MASQVDNKLITTNKAYCSQGARLMKERAKAPDNKKTASTIDELIKKHIKACRQCQKAEAATDGETFDVTA